MRRWQVLLLVASAAGSTAACNASSCTFESEPAIIVTVIDSVTSQNLTPGSAVVARQGFFVDSVLVSPTSTATSVPLAYDRPGIYTVIVHRSGYRDWRRDGVPVPGTGCGVRDPATVTARLIK